MHEDLENITISEDSGFDQILEALAQIAGPQIGSGFVMVIDQKGVLVGVITDSDLRRALLRHKNLVFTAADVMNKNFAAISGNRVLEDVAGTFREIQWKTFNPLKAIPVLDEFGRPQALLEVTGREKNIVRSRDAAVVIGLGFVGSTLAAVLANVGVHTYGIDSNSEVVDMLREGVSVTREEGLEQALKGGIESGHLRFGYSLEDLPAVTSGMRRFFVVTVGTPLVGGIADIASVREVVGSISSHLKRGDAILLRSTVPIGTSREMATLVETARGWRVGIDFYVASTPERTVEGQALRELSTLPQIVGGVTARCTHVARTLFEQFAPSTIDAPSAEFAELVKLSSNAYRDYTFAFSNFLAEVSSGHGIDVNHLIEVANLGYPRNQIAQPSPGVGGPCLTKDPHMFPPTGVRGLSMESPVLSARNYNEEFVGFQSLRLFHRISQLGINSVASLGMAFKGEPETNDLRGSTGIEIARNLQDRGVEVDTWDAVVGDGAGGFESVTEDKAYGAVLLLNNHRNNIEMANRIISKCDVRLVFDPWRLLQRKSKQSEHNQREDKFLYMTLSNDYE